MKERRRKGGQAGRGGKMRQLVRLNSKITRLSSELETLQFLQDRLERELTPSYFPGPSRRRSDGAT